jgi:type I restriction enzyme S subunit
MGEVNEEIRIEKYSSYKNSSIEWFGEVPKHWKIKPGFTIVQERKEKNIGLVEKIVLSLSHGRVIIKSEEKLTGLVPESFETYQQVYPGDIIVRPTDLQNDKTSLRTGLAKDRGIITSAYINLKVKKEYSTSFYHYFLHTIDITKVIYGLGTGLRQNLGFGEFKRLKFLVPPVEEQIAIADFLDRNTALIDKAIAIKERQIELLKENRQILIHKAVTRGLDHRVKTKDSGVEWIGEVPEHWEIRHMRRLFKFLNTKRIPLSAEEREKKPGPYPYYGASGIIDYIDGYIFNEPLILIAEDGANLLSKSTPLAFVALGEYWVNNHAHIIKPLYRGFTFWAELLSSVDYRASISGAAQPKLTMDRLGSIRLPLPPENEIDQICVYIDKIVVKIELAQALKEKEIEKLVEYKSSLINSAVTGKIKVC